MIKSLKVATENLKFSKMAVSQKTEPPVLTFHRMAYGYVNNDWMAVISGGLRLVLTFGVMIFLSSKSITV
jgi:hypothetical protein